MKWTTILLISVWFLLAGCSGPVGPSGDASSDVSSGEAAISDDASDGSAGEENAEADTEVGDAVTPEAPDEGELERKAVPIESGVAQLSPENTKIQFVGKHTNERPDRTGGFERFTGQVEVDPASNALTSIHVEIEADSLSTQFERLTNHLKSADFFEVREFPTATFHSTSIEATDAGSGQHRISGELTLHGVTQEISFPAVVNFTGAGLTLTSQFVIDRMQFGVDFGPDQVKTDVSMTIVVGERTEPLGPPSGS